MPGKDGLITSERSLALKMSREQEKQLLLTKRQKISSQTHKVIEGKGYPPEEVFDADRSTLFWKKGSVIKNMGW